MLDNSPDLLAVDAMLQDSINKPEANGYLAYIGIGGTRLVVLGQERGDVHIYEIRKI